MDSVNESISKLEISNEKSIKISQKEFFKLIEEKKEDLCIQYVNNGQLEVIDCTDDHGMTALQYAAYRGLYNLTNLLIKNGANVNANTHDQGYSALMFAAISNHTNVVQLLLENNANIDVKNHIGRTATQMAAFVNSTNAVDIINNYISKSDLEYYTKVNSIYETEPKLPVECVDDLHKLLTGTYFSPIYIIKKIYEQSNIIMKNIDKILKTLDVFIARAFNKTNDDLKCPNDILSFKLHYYKFILEYLKLQMNKIKSAPKKEETDGDLNECNLYKNLFDFVIRQFLNEEFVTDVKRNYRMFEEKFIREAIIQFPYKESGLLRQMVQILHKVKLGADPSALYVLESSLNGQRFSNNDEESSDSGKIYFCATCSNKNAKLCSKCKTKAYCDRYCQQAHWFLHKKECAQLIISSKSEQKNE